MEKYPRIGVGIIIKKGKKIVLLKRKGSHGEGEWCLPGGWLEFGETFKNCAVREIKEETGLETNQEELNFISLSEELDYLQSDGKHCLTVGFIVNYHGVKKPKICEPDKSVAIGWFDLDSLPTPLFVPSKDIIDNFQERRTFKGLD